MERLYMFLNDIYDNYALTKDDINNNIYYWRDGYKLNFIDILILLIFEVKEIKTLKVFTEKIPIKRVNFNTLRPEVKTYIEEKKLDEFETIYIHLFTNNGIIILGYDYAFVKYDEIDEESIKILNIEKQRKYPYIYLNIFDNLITFNYNNKYYELNYINGNCRSLFKHDFIDCFNMENFDNYNEFIKLKDNEELISSTINENIIYLTTKLNNEKKQIIYYPDSSCDIIEKDILTHIYGLNAYDDNISKIKNDDTVKNDEQLMKSYKKMIGEIDKETINKLHELGQDIE